MRLGRKLVAFGVFAALAAPASGHAVEAYALPQLVRDVIVTAKVQHGASGKTGTMSFTLRSYQGIEVYKVPTAQNNGEGLDDLIVDPHTGLPDPGSVVPGAPGMPVATGLIRYTGCLTLKIPTILSVQDECDLDGSARIDTDPQMATVAVQATYGQSTEFQTNVSLSIEGTGDLTTSRADKQDVAPEGEWYGLGYDADLQQYLERTGIIVAGVIFHEEDTRVINVLPDDQSVTLRTGIVAKSFAHRYPLVCAEGDGVPVTLLGEKPGTGTPAEPFVPDYVPVNGCQPDDAVPADVPALPLPEELPDVPVPEAPGVPAPELPELPVPLPVPI